ncbi:diguanylate cyclase [Telmatospirillum siberiense]|uniref:diguanylate cyclase n=1 Tax=Telmatospirillum siberiense TaxID=382514 RepID=A0A2N3PRY8_9PROT|nr:diguanylate cyclase [Telmatospirillum siberiense]PKU23171.1 deoxyribodipyrimidine photolyase [Telmatospirillum siberiense]
MRRERQHLIRSLFDEYIQMYASRDDRLTGCFSEDFSGYTGGGDFLVKDRAEWVKITRQDFAQVTNPIRIEIRDISMQDISEDVVVVTAFFHIHLPFIDHILSRETARLVLIYRLEGKDWKIVHSGISVPYHLVRDDEVFPIRELHERNRELESLVEERTRELEEANTRLEVLSNTDALTGIANRRNFDRMLAQEWNRAQRAGTALSLVMLDVDYFKHFNDLYGHLAGDGCLRTLAQTLAQSQRRGGELAARYGGEEFVVLLPNAGGHDALETARHIQREVWSLALPHAETPPGIVTVSLGVASRIPLRQHIPEDLVRQADSALYRAKQSGRNCLQLATD